jgi:hypothetical protein
VLVLVIACGIVSDRQALGFESVSAPAREEIDAGSDHLVMILSLAVKNVGPVLRKDRRGVLYV